VTQWGFYGRRRERAELAQVLEHGRWFFLQISGRRRIGKTRLVLELYEERSRLGIGDFPLTSPIKGWWDRRGDTEIDLVALDETSKRLRLGSCKRSELALIKDLARFDGHVSRFLKAFPHLSDWQVEKVAIAPSLTPEAQQAIAAAGYLPQSLDDLTLGLRC